MTCPFCGRDPFHYVDNGVGMEAVAVTCCGLGDALFRGARPDPEEVTLSWEEFTEIAETLRNLRAQVQMQTEHEDIVHEGLCPACGGTHS